MPNCRCDHFNETSQNKVSLSFTSPSRVTLLTAADRERAACSAGAVGPLFCTALYSIITLARLLRCTTPFLLLLGSLNYSRLLRLRDPARRVLIGGAAAESVARGARRANDLLMSATRWGELLYHFVACQMFARIQRMFLIVNHCN